MPNYFKLLRGVHSEGGNVYRKGDCFESKSNLSVHNHKNSVRFQKLSALPTKEEQSALEVSPKYTELELSSLRLTELQQLCEDEEIDIEGLRKKREIVDKIVKELGINEVNETPVEA